MLKPPFGPHSSWFRWLIPFTGAIATSLSLCLPLKAAETIYFIYPPLRLSLRVSSLETFAKDGTVNKNLEFYLGLPGLSEEEITAFREALNKRAEVDPVLLSRLFNTEIGEEILTFFGQVTNVQGGRNGKYIIRGALVQAAFDQEEGLTLLNFFKKLSVNIDINLSKAQQMARFVDLAVEGTNYATEEIIKLSEQETAAAAAVDFSQRPDLRQSGPFEVAKQRWTLTDASRQRTFYVEVHKPKRWRSGKTPVVIISHGLSSKPEDFAGRAEHLASYGYVVAAPQHIGSDSQWTQDLLAGYNREVFDRNDFIERPLDISYVIDELERRNQREFEGRLDLANVGVLGHSFGGYTALAVAGATPDFDYLERICDPYLKKVQTLNTALLLQCRALNLERKAYNFRDKRVKAVIGANPVNRAIFGPQGLGKIEIPTAIGAGNYDPATPFIFEQVRSFPWLKTPDKYLLMLEGQAHVDFSQLDAGITDLIDSVDELTLPSPDLLADYINAAGLAFFEVHIANNPDYRIYLQPAYFNYLSQGEEFKAYMITGASSDELTEVIERFRNREGITGVAE